MPQKYIRKDSARKYGYSNEAMQNAIKEVKKNGMSIKKAVFLYNVNRSTLIITVRVTTVVQLVATT